jgi:putative zinc finger protein
VSRMTCDRAGELLSDDLEGALPGELAAEIASHLVGCGECRALRAALADVALLLRVPAVEPGADLAERVARASWAAGRAPILRAERSRAWANAAATWAGWLTEVPFAVQAVAAGFALVLTAGLVMAAGSGPGAPARPRVTQRLTDAAVYVLERKDRLVEDFRLLRVVVATAFEGRVDRVNDRVDDYRRLLDRRQKDAQPKDERGNRNKKSDAVAASARWAAARPPAGKTSEPASRAARRSV